MSLPVLALLLAAGSPLPAPVAQAVVYSDRARVTRTGDAQVNGTQSFTLPLLPETVDASTIRVDAQGAEIRRVDLTPATDEAFPTQEAKSLYAELLKLEDAQARTRGELQAVQAQLGLFRRLSPAVPVGEAQRATPKLNAQGWAAALAFSEEQSRKLQTKEQELEDEAERQREAHDELLEKARKLGGVGRMRGTEVSVTLAGQGPAKVNLTYVTQRARWFPLYDLQLEPDTGKVQVTLSGLVSQESGEDWTDAKLQLSTAVPATATVAPKLLTWKVGEKERFIPTPSPVPESFRPPPRAVPLLPVEREDEAWRERIAEVVAQGQVGEGGASGRVGGKALPQRNRLRPAADDSEGDGDVVSAEAQYMPAPPPMAEPSSVPRPTKPTRLESVDKRRAKKESVSRSMGRPSAPAAAAPSADYSRDEAYEISSDSGGFTPTEGFSLAPPPGYRPQSFGAETPVALAGGYDLLYTALRPESVPTGKGTRKITLVTETWPVKVERKLFPALAKEAYLVAEMKSPSSKVLPGGNAQLFVGADPAGQARLKLVAPGETLTLPLGLDRAIRPVRNVKVTQAEKGFIGKQEVNEYVVTTEVSNPYGVPVALRVLDQWPLTDQKEDVEVKLISSQPLATQDQAKGTLEWRVTVPPAGKQTFTFTYSIRRPYGWRLHQ